MVQRIIGLLVAVLLIVPATAVAAPQAGGDYVIVTFKNRPLASYEGGVGRLAATKPVRGKLDPTSPAYRAYERHLDNEHANFRAFLKKNAPRATVVREFKVVLNGFALELNGTDPAALTRSNLVKAVGSSWLYEPTLTASLDIISAAAGWGADREDAGADINIAIIDSGIDAEHPLFECKGDIPSKVYASGNAFFHPDRVLVNDHGTHVAGIAAGCVMELEDGPFEGETISGVAPGANLSDYNVFPGFGGGFLMPRGSAFSHDIAAAIEDAVDDGIHVINMSLGGGIQGPHDFLAEASNAAVDAGVVVVASAGNEGPGAGTVGSPGNAANVIAVGATTNDHAFGVPIEVEGVGTFVGYVGDFDPFEDHPVTGADFVRWSTTDDRACNTTPGPEGDVADAVVLIQRGTCTFSEKIANAAAAGAVGAVIYNNVDGVILMAGDSDIPAVSITLDDGLAIRAELPRTVTITGPQLTPAEPNVIADFSSRGPGSFLNNIKPDVVAPGDFVYSSVFDGEFDFFSGTSMSSPHVAGAAALLLADNPDLSPNDVKSLLGNNADRDLWLDEPNGEVAGVMDRGGGQVNIARALAAEATFAPFSLGFGRHNGARQVNVSITVEVKNMGAAQTEFTISTDDDRLSVPPASLTLDPGETGVFTVSLSARGSFDGEGDVKVTGGGHEYLLPYWYSTGNIGR